MLAKKLLGNKSKREHGYRRLNTIKNKIDYKERNTKLEEIRLIKGEN